LPLLTHAIAAAIILPVAADVYCIIAPAAILTTYNQCDRISEAGRANDLQIFSRFILGASQSIIAVLVLFTAVGYWNTYLTQ
jgi:hypothetical protein